MPALQFQAVGWGGGRRHCTDNNVPITKMTTSQDIDKQLGPLLPINISL